MLHNDKRIAYLMEFSQVNENLEEFSEIIDVPRMEVVTDGFLKKRQENIELFEALMVEFKGLKWINHKKHLEEQIEWFKKMIEQEELRRILQDL